MTILPPALRKLSSVRDVSPFCTAFIARAVLEDWTEDQLAQAIAKSASLDPALGELWEVFFEKAAAPGFLWSGEGLNMGSSAAIKTPTSVGPPEPQPLKLPPPAAPTPPPPPVPQAPEQLPPPSPTPPAKPPVQQPTPAPIAGPPDQGEQLRQQAARGNFDPKAWEAYHRQQIETNPDFHKQYTGTEANASYMHTLKQQLTPEQFQRLQARQVPLPPSAAQHLTGLKDWQQQLREDIEKLKSEQAASNQRASGGNPLKWLDPRGAPAAMMGVHEYRKQVAAKEMQLEGLERTINSTIDMNNPNQMKDLWAREMTDRKWQEANGNAALPYNKGDFYNQALVNRSGEEKIKGLTDMGLGALGMGRATDYRIAPNDVKVNLNVADAIPGMSTLRRVAPIPGVSSLPNMDVTLLHGRNERAQELKQEEFDRQNKMLPAIRNFQLPAVADKQIAPVQQPQQVNQEGRLADYAQQLRGEYGAAAGEDINTAGVIASALPVAGLAAKGIGAGGRALAGRAGMSALRGGAVGAAERGAATGALDAGAGTLGRGAVGETVAGAAGRGSTTAVGEGAAGQVAGAAERAGVTAAGEGVAGAAGEALAGGAAKAPWWQRALSVAKPIAQGPSYAGESALQGALTRYGVGDQTAGRIMAGYRGAAIPWRAASGEGLWANATGNGLMRLPTLGYAAATMGIPSAAAALRGEKVDVPDLTGQALGYPFSIYKTVDQASGGKLHAALGSAINHYTGRTLPRYQTQEGNQSIFGDTADRFRDLGEVGSHVGGLVTSHDPVTLARTENATAALGDMSENAARRLATGAAAAGKMTLPDKDLIEQEAQMKSLQVKMDNQKNLIARAQSSVDNPEMPESRKVIDRQIIEKANRILQETKAEYDSRIVGPPESAGAPNYAGQAGAVAGGGTLGDRELGSASPTAIGPRNDVDTWSAQEGRGKAFARGGLDQDNQVPEASSTLQVHSDRLAKEIEHLKSIPPNQLPPEQQQHLQKMMQTHAELQGANKNIGNYIKQRGLTPDQLASEVKDSNSQLSRDMSEGRIRNDPTVAAEAEKLRLTPPETSQYAKNIWDQLGNYKWLVVGGLGLAAISMLSSLFGGSNDDEEGGHGGSTFMRLAPLLGLGTAAYGLSGGQPSRLLQPKFWGDTWQGAKSLFS